MGNDYDFGRGAPVDSIGAELFRREFEEDSFDEAKQRHRKAFEYTSIIRLAERILVSRPSENPFAEAENFFQKCRDYLPALKADVVS